MGAFVFSDLFFDGYGIISLWDRLSQSLKFWCQLSREYTFSAELIFGATLPWADPQAGDAPACSAGTDRRG